MAVSIKDHVALITGASRGIGRACALALAGEGCRLVLTAHDPLKLALITAECCALGVDVEATQADLADTAELPELVEGAVSRFGQLDILVNNAGVCYEQAALGAKLDEWDAMLNINLRAPMHLTRHALPHILASAEAGRRAALIFLASLSGIRTYKDGAGYCATKFGLVGFARAVFDDVAGRGVKVCSICPGWVNTDMAEGSGIDPATMLQPEEVAEAVRLAATWPDTGCPRELHLNPQRIGWEL
jgi:NAD(P)-dependent dehydrogenase (short-subunit alcohol dehydrogenase family)